MLFMEAAALRTPSRDILKVASESALEHGDTSLANAVFQKLPSPPPPEAAGNLLRFYAGTGGKDTDEEVLRMYTSKFKNVDLSGEAAAMHVVAMADIRAW